MLDPTRQAQTLRVLRLGGSSCRTRRSRTRSGRRACCRSRSPKPQARDGIRALVRPAVARAERAQARALTDTVQGIYLPYWTFDAQADADWTAEAGHYYYTTETYDGNGQTQTRQVQRIRWEPAAGRAAALLRRRTRVRVGRRARRARSAASSRFRRSELDAVRSRATSPAGSSSATRSISSAPRSARARRWTRSCGAVRAADSRRHVPQSRRPRRLLGADVQAHPRAGLAADLQLRRAARSSA